MNISGFENTKKIADEIQNITDGNIISNKLGTNNINEPLDSDISDFNKGVDVMTNFGNYHVVTESIFSKKPKSGVYHPVDEEQDIDDIMDQHPMLDIEKSTKQISDIVPEDKMKNSDEEFDRETDRRKAIMDRRSGVEDRKSQRRK